MAGSPLKLSTIAQLASCRQIQLWGNCEQIGLGLFATLAGTEVRTSVTDNSCTFDRDVVTRNGDVVHVGWIYPRPSGVGGGVCFDTVNSGSTPRLKTHIESPVRGRIDHRGGADSYTSFTGAGLGSPSSTIFSEAAWSRFRSASRGFSSLLDEIFRRLRDRFSCSSFVDCSRLSPFGIPPLCPISVNQDVQFCTRAGAGFTNRSNLFGEWL